MRRLALPLVIVVLLVGWLAGQFGSGPADLDPQGQAATRAAAESLPAPEDRPGTGAADGPADDPVDDPAAASAARALPPEAEATIALIQAGGPFPYRKDGSVFQNRERRLPDQPRGYYREYTVPTPGESDRGARRIVTGGEPPDVFYYTADHYRSFRQLEGLP
jgi:ribonuclease T1